MSDPILQFVVPGLWLAWLVYWGLSARDVKPTRWQESGASRLLHRGPLIIAMVLLAFPNSMPAAIRGRFLPPGRLFPVLGTITLAAGLGFSVWARRHLGRNWSAHVVVKEDHALVRTGPYRRVRHPIYTGILLAFFGMAVVVGEWRALVAFAAAAASFAIKAHLEEQQMLPLFPEYAEYRRETAAIVPFIW